MPTFVVEQLKDALDEKGISLKGSKVTVLGLSYKPNVGDMRESPSIKIIKRLVEQGARVAAHDPYIADNIYAASQHAKSIKLIDPIMASIFDADAVIVATAHNEYDKLDMQSIEAFGVKVIIDGRNCLNKQQVIAAGMVYRGIGR